MNNSDIKEILRLARQIYADAMKLRKPTLSQVELDMGLQSSKTACQQEERVYYSPLMKNMLEQIDHVPDDFVMTIKTPRTKAEEWVYSQATEILTKRFGTQKEYNTSEPIDSCDHYTVDCWHNLKEDMRQIVPGQADERAKALAEFGTPVDPEEMFNFMETDPLAAVAIRRLVELVPRVVADTDFTETSAPFETKHTNVGYKWWKNDRVKSPDGETYGKVALHTAEKLDFKSIDAWNVCTAFGRNQRGKGRPLIAMSRVANLFLNRLEAREIELYKDIPFFIGYRNDTDLREAMEQMCNYALKHDLICWNWDQSGFDRHINPALLALVGAISENAASSALGKKLAHKRAMFGIHSWLVNGMTGRFEEIYGRMFSGFIDTNRGDSLVEYFLFTWALMKLDLLWTKHVSRTKYFMFGMGDDILALLKADKYDPKKLEELMDSVGFELNTAKSAFGLFFLQYRLFHDNEGSHFVYPWTRVLLSLLFLERSRGLGPCGWLISQYQQLSKLTDYQPAIDAVVSIIYKFDKMKLGTDMSVKQIIEGIKAEDDKALKESKGTQYRSTAEKLFDGDPAKQRWFTSDGELDSSYIAQVHEAICASVKRVTSSKTA